ncbi:MAG TPA: hypothetical protein VN408_02365 [Actinoplanes sp.]|nr:hypothetical protein [Actinoplanes sp.]
MRAPDVPLFFTEWGGWPDVNWLMAAEFVTATALLSIVLAWLFNRTSESLPVVMLFHANINTLYSLLWPAVFPHLNAYSDSLHSMLIGATVAAAVTLLATRGRLGLTPAPHAPAAVVRV